MLVVISITSLLLTSTAIALNSLFRVDRQLRNDLATGTVLSRLSLQLRDDAHRAIDVVLKDGEASSRGVVLRMNDGHTIEYVSGSGRLVRLVKQEAAVSHREIFQMTREAQLDWQLSTLHDRLLITLRIESPGAGPRAPQVPRGDRIVAAVGLGCGEWEPDRE
jgi:type II secretory pathway component PulJ